MYRTTPEATRPPTIDATYTFNFDDSEADELAPRLAKMADDILANPVTEDYEVKL